LLKFSQQHVCWRGSAQNLIDRSQGLAIIGRRLNNNHKHYQVTEQWDII